MGSFTPAAPTDISSIVSQLTTEEKIALVAGRDFWTTNPVERLGVPSLKTSDGPNGARGVAFKGGLASACFPASVSLAATFDRSLAKRIGKGLGEETKTKGASVLLGPTVCPHRDPRGGRNFESFSEDPFLAGELASEYIKGLQQEGIGATIKHYAVNESETKRFTIDARLSQRALREIYLKPFEIAVKKADPWALMTSYNHVNGTHADMNKFLITKVLREEWGFKGLVMSDWGGTNSTAESLNAGHDLEMPGPPLRRTAEKVSAALKNGELTEQTLNERVEKFLNLLVKTDVFNNPVSPDEKAIDLPEHRQLIREAGAEGMVLLKNTNNILPLQPSQVKSIGLIGLAKEFLGHGGGSAAVNAHHKITPYDALSEALGNNVQLNYAEGVRILRNLRPLTENVVDDEGKPGFTCRVETNSGASEIKNIEGSTFQALERIDIKSTHITGTFRPKTSGSHYFSFSCLGESRVLINDVEFYSVPEGTIDVMAMLLGTAAEERRQYKFEAGQSYRIQIESKAMAGGSSDLAMLANPLVCINVGFSYEAEFEADLLSVAVETAKTSDVAVVFVGHTPVWETEGCDRDSMDLPVDGSQDALIRAVAEVNKNVIVVNSTGSPVTMPWVNDVAAIVQAWFPGQEAGHSIADVLLGKVNPGGKLPVTFSKKIEDAPSFGNFPFTGDLQDLKVDYKEDIFMGYRHYDRKPETVLFPFGYGLSYTTFSFSDVAVSETALSPSSVFTVSATVKNTGSVNGSETVQVYVGPSEGGPTERPLKILAGFTRSQTLEAQATEVVTVSVSVQESFSHWDEEKYGWVVPKGKYTVSVGTSSSKADILAEIVVEVAEDAVFKP